MSFWACIEILLQMQSAEAKDFGGEVALLLKVLHCGHGVWVGEIDNGKQVE